MELFGLHLTTAETQLLTVLGGLSAAIVDGE
jgi:hypothetical protein